ncbi:MAG: hypothetical protein AB7I36_15295 [Rhodospirillaceae bacterium]
MSADSPLERAKTRVVDARARVFVQEQRLADIHREGRNATSAEYTLDALRRALLIFEAEYEAALIRSQSERA